MKKGGVLFLFFCVFTIGGWGQNAGYSIEEISKLIDAEEFAQADTLLTRAFEDKNLSLDTLEYADAIHYSGKLAHRKGEFEKADKLYRQALAIRKNISGEASAEYAQSLYAVGELLCESDCYEASKEYLEKSMIIRKKLFGKKSFEYVESVAKLGVAHIFSENLVEGKRNLDEALKGIKELPEGTNHILYGNILRHIGNYYFVDHKFSAAENYYNQSAEVSLRVVGDKSLSYARDLLQKSTALLNQRRFSTLESLWAQAERIYKEKNVPNHPDLFSICIYSWAAAMLSGSYKEAELISKRALKKVEQNYTKESRYYAQFLNDLAVVYQRTGKMENVEPLLSRSIDVKKKVFGKEAAQTLESMNILAHFYRLMGNYKKAEKEFIKIRDIAKENDYRTAYIRSLNALGIVYSSLGKNDKAIDSYKEAISAAVQFDRREAHDYTQIINNMLVELNREDGKEPLDDVYSFVLKRYEETVGKKSFNYATILLNYSTYLSYQKRYNESLDMTLQALLLVNSLEGGKRSSLRTHLQSNLALTMKHVKGADEYLSLYYNQLLESIKEEVYKNFIFLSEEERDLFLETKNISIDEIKRYAYYNRKNENGSFAALAYNNELFVKSILLASSSQVHHSILNSGDNELIEAWNAFRRSKDQLVANSGDKEAVLPEEEITALEKAIMQKSKYYIDFRKNYDMGWESVRDVLKENQAAIEFVAFDELNSKNRRTGDRIYYALLLRPDSQHPIVLQCCKESALLEALKEPYNTSVLHKLVWAPLNNQLLGITEIYVSPTGLLHQIAFGGLKNSTSSSYLADIYNIRNVMSTRDLVASGNAKQNMGDLKRATLFGGADYDLSLQEESFASGSSDSLDIERGRGFDYLPGSRKEVQVINDILSASAYEVDLYVDKNATEEKVKALSSKTQSVLHLSTHGFYYPLAKRKGSQVNIYKQSKNPLLRSGLLFTGANNSWEKTEKNIDSNDDGILTAYEISHLDLSRTGLVVLSACNTGKGDIINDEGTYGLQRAFRLAGAQSMIVTLWEISDSDTVLFMEEFYSKWMAGASLNGAFVSAQKKLRIKYPHQVERWAGFVLIE